MKMKKKVCMRLLSLLVMIAVFSTMDGVLVLAETAESEAGVYAEGKEADTDGFEIADGVLKKYIGTATEVVIPNSVTSIGSDAFSGCSNLTSITIPDSVTNIGGWAFCGCSGLTSITIPNSVTSIGMYAFRDCSALTSITIPDSVASIESMTFYCCSALTSITIPDSITSIKTQAFGYCSSLTDIMIPDSVISIDGAFNHCSGLTSIKVEEGNPKYDSRDNCNAIIETESNTLEQGCKNTVIPLSVTNIESGAFSGCSGLTSITIPDSITSIELGTFSGCSGLTSITIPDSVTSIGSRVFEFCSGLTSITIPNSVTSIGWETFSGCSGLTSITIPNGVTSIGSDAFCGCSGLTSIEVKEGNSKYDSRDNCNAVIETESNTLVQGCKNTVIPPSVVSIGYYAFCGCSGLTSIKIPDSVTSIGGGAFSDCSGLTSITIPESVINIKNDCADPTFSGCSKEFTIYGKTGSYAEIYAKEHDIKFYSIGTVGNSGTEPDNIPVAMSVSTVGKLYQESSGEGKIDLICHESLFAKDATEYNHELAKFAAGMSAMVYNEKEKTENVSNALKGMGYKYNTDIADTLKDSDGDKAPYCLASKTVKLNGEKTNIVLVTVRGTYEKEWIDNFDPGSSLSDSTHKGFQRGCDYVYNALCEYIKNNNLNKGNLKILVAGHSRGAAVANLLGAKLDDYGVSSGSFSVNISNKDIFVYTFATPNTTMLARRNDAKFNNIYNVVNPEDFVTKVLPSDWGFGRYGVTYVLPSQSTEHWVYGKQQNHVKYGDYLENLNKFYTEHNFKGKYEPYDSGMVPVSNYINLITETVPTKRKYYTKNLLFGYDFDNVGDNYTLKNLYTHTLGYLMSKNVVYQVSGFDAIMDAAKGKWGSVGRKTVAYFFKHEVGSNLPLSELKPDFSSAHRSETYLAAMNVLSKEQLQQNRRTLLGIVNCPVDITVKDESGEIVGQIINNEIVQSSENGIVMAVDGESKTFTLPIEAEYTVELNGNDDGFMDYSLCEVDPDMGEVSRTYYSNLPVSAHVAYTQEITEDSQISSFELKDGENNVIESTGVLNETEIGQLSVDVTVEGIGSANGLVNLSPGDYVSLEAIADKNNEFLGWYDTDGNLISADNIHSFSIQENQSFVAKFTDVVVDCADIQFEKESLEMETGEESVIIATMFPENATYKWIRYSSSDTSVVEVGDYGLLKAVGEGTAIIAATSEDGKSSATMTVTVKDGLQNPGTETSKSYTYKLNDDKTTITITKCTSSNENIVIPSAIDGYTVTGIGDKAFQNVTSMKTVSFPSTLKTIGNYAFVGCTSLTTVTLPDSLTGLYTYVFKGCTSLKSAKLNAGRINVTEGLFHGCTSLSSVTLPSSVQYIREYAFYGCSSLKTLSLPKSLVTVFNNAFLSSGIKSIKYAGTSTNWKKITIYLTGNTKFLNATVTGSDSKTFSADSSKWNMVKPVKKPTVSKVKSFKATAGKKKLTLTWKKLSGAAGYQIQISTKKDFKGAKTISISKSKKTYTKKSLKAKKKYYLRIRAYKTYKDANKKTKKVYGKWTTMSKKTK